MRLIINSSSVFKGGAEQVALSFMHECRSFMQHEYHIIISSNLASQINKNDFPDNFTFHLIKKRPASSIIQFLKMLFWFKKFEKRIKPDCVISTGGHGYWRPKVPLVGGFNIPHYIYPESPYFKNMSLKKKLFWIVMRKIHLYFYNRLDAIFVQTDDVKERLEKLVSSKIKIYTVSNTVNSYFTDKKLYNNKLPERSRNEIRLLTVCSYYSHKNLEILNQVHRELEDCGYNNFRFVLTLPDIVYQKTFTEDCKKRIYNIGPIPIRECPSLYSECDYMFLPTLLECFSASYAEAMVMKKPILTSDLSFAHTVCKSAAIYFNPLDSKDIANKIIAISNNKTIQEAMLKKATEISSGFITANDRARFYLQICKETIEKMKK